MNGNIRLATDADFAGMHRLRMSVRENRLRDPQSVQLEDYRRIVADGGRGWVCEEQGHVIGFAVADFKRTNVWALFVDPAQERKGVGRRLHDTMMEWFFASGASCVWLGTGTGTRAQGFYEAAGWRRIGTLPNGEACYELQRDDWQQRIGHR